MNSVTMKRPVSVSQISLDGNYVEVIERGGLSVLLEATQAIFTLRGCESHLGARTLLSASVRQHAKSRLEKGRLYRKTHAPFGTQKATIETPFA
jgi:hypothetical protein